MTDLRKAAEMALEALMQKGEHHPKVYQAAEALRQALAEGRSPLYTAPPKKEWVGLTDEEIYDYADKFLYQHGSNYGIKSFGKAIEAKLKEKNSG